MIEPKAQEKKESDSLEIFQEKENTPEPVPAPSFTNLKNQPPNYFLTQKLQLQEFAASLLGLALGFCLYK